MPATRIKTAVCNSYPMTAIHILVLLATGYIFSRPTRPIDVTPSYQWLELHALHPFSSPSAASITGGVSGMQSRPWVSSGPVDAYRPLHALLRVGLRSTQGKSGLYFIFYSIRCLQYVSIKFFTWWETQEVRMIQKSRKAYLG
jgi:hypothetical protein